MKRLLLLFPLILIGYFQSPSQTPDYRARATNRIVTFNDDGAWSWFQDERAIVDRGRLIIGSVAAGTDDDSRKGDIEVMTYDIGAGSKKLSQLHDRLLDARGIYDDHNSPALLVRPDGRLLAVYSMHGPENRFYYRISTRPHDPTRWQPREASHPVKGRALPTRTFTTSAKKTKAEGESTISIEASTTASSLLTPIQTIGERHGLQATFSLTFPTGSIIGRM
jgi:hypothetical protein